MNLLKLSVYSVDAIVCKLDSVGETYICEANTEEEERDKGPTRLKHIDATICNFVLKERANYKEIEDGALQKTFVFNDLNNDSFFEPVKESIESWSCIHGSSAHGMVISQRVQSSWQKQIQDDTGPMKILSL